MKVYFFRHGIAHEREAWSGDDDERPLTEDGIKLMSAEAKTIARLGLDFDLILCSPLARALQTAQIVAKALGTKKSIEIESMLAPGFNVPDLAAILEQHGALRNLLLVGHEPDMSRTIGAITGGGRIICRKGSLACVKLTDLVEPSGELAWLLPPNFLAR